MRVDVKKTYKLYIGGAFPRSESGRVYELKDSKGEFLANPCQASRKDFRDAVVSARSAVTGWNKATAYNRGQILYRVAEILEGRTFQFAEEIVAMEGVNFKEAKAQVEAAIDCWVWYAGWCDKIASVSGSTNSVSGPYYNFTVPENLGVVTVFADQKSSLLGLVAGLAAVLAGGNTAIVIASEKYPLSAITLSEVLATSDVPAGVVNILTGYSAELAPWVGAHMDVDGIDVSGLSKKTEEEVRLAGAENLKRIHRFNQFQSLGRIQAFMENKTVWHPIGV
ncbi:MAG: aldehyde dehydrogenase family protein [Actinomycetes bacterium]